MDNIDSLYELTTTIAGRTATIRSLPKLIEFPIIEIYDLQFAPSKQVAEVTERCVNLLESKLDSYPFLLFETFIEGNLDSICTTLQPFARNYHRISIDIGPYDPVLKASLVSFYCERRFRSGEDFVGIAFERTTTNTFDLSLNTPPTPCESTYVSGLRRNDFNYIERFFVRPNPQPHQVRERED